MAEAAFQFAQEQQRLSESPLLRRLLMQAYGRKATAAAALPADGPEPEDAADPRLARLDAEIRIMKAVLRSERLCAAELRAQLAEASARVAPRDRRVSVVEIAAYAQP